MSSKIITSFSETSMTEFVNSGDSLYIEDVKVYVKRFSGFDDYAITDIEHALKTGLSCNKYSIRSDAPNGNLVVTNWIEQKFGGDVTKLVVYLKALKFEPDHGCFKDINRYFTVEGHVITFSLNILKSINIYSPFNHQFVKPLIDVPKKWTLQHVRKAIINGQFDNLKCKGIYTDNYAFDAECNFQAGEIKNALRFIKGIIESPSGWWTSIENNNVSVCCYSSDSNSFDLNINKGRD